MNFLDFEKPVQELLEQIDKIKQVGEKGKVDTASTVKELEDKIVEARTDIASKLTPWQKVQLSRHPDRPYTLDYIEALTEGTFFELHGDRNVKDDKAMVGGLGKLTPPEGTEEEGMSIMFIGQQ